MHLHTRRREDNWNDAVQDACPFYALLLFQMQDLLEIEPFHFDWKRLLGMGKI